jgi:hypothetical protein
MGIATDRQRDMNARAIKGFLSREPPATLAFG